MVKMIKILSCIRLSAFVLLGVYSINNYANDAKNIEQVSQKNSALSGGGATVFAAGRNAFSLPSANIPLLEKLDFNVGNSFFRNPWVIAPASTDARDGLGPLFNTNGCQNCHIKDGRGHAPSSHSDNAVSLLVRLSIPETATHLRKPHESVIAEPNYGGQLQDFAIPGVEPEGRVRIDYSDVIMTFVDGEKVTLRKPSISITQLAYGELHPSAQLSARIAPPMIGLGLLEAISEKDIRQLADPDDNDSNGISGRTNEVWSKEKNQLMLGRFGWKAGEPTVHQQNAGAFNGDIGLTSSLFQKDDCTAAQVACLKAPNGNNANNVLEVSDKILNFVTFYTKNLAVPARRNIDKSSVRVGEGLFTELGCVDCHRPKWKTSPNYSMSWLANQTIYPYTDLLLHDMGEGLADNRPEFLANGREWRTPPLWGIGLSKVVSKEAGFLHDGRARNLTEAILWHGGEASASQQAFMMLSKNNRNAVIDFLNSL